MANETLNNIKNIFSKSEQINVPLSYGAFLNDIIRFRKAGGSNDSDDFNIFDTPAQKYFKIFFYFFNGSDDDSDFTEYSSSGLLAPTWQLQDQWDDDDYWKYTSAWAYLKMNNDEERADLLQKFIYLLSNINSCSPWYFSSIENLEGALSRNELTEKEFKLSEERKKITIKCLPDAYDNRISTLLHLYRTIAYSWQQKKYILPANLRKFDMGIYIFEAPIKNLHGNINTDNNTYTRNLFGEAQLDQTNSNNPSNSNFANIGVQLSSKYLTSYRYIEFHNCEIDPDSCKSGMSTLDNTQGVNPTYSIDIFFDDCYEREYNEFLTRHIGDVIAIDTALYDAINDNMIESVPQQDQSNLLQELYRRSEVYKSKSFTEGVINELTGSGARYLKNAVKKVALGNIFAFSLSRLNDQLDALKSGHIWTTIGGTKAYIKNNKLKNSVKNNTDRTQALGNIFKNQSIGNNI